VSNAQDSLPLLLSICLASATLWIIELHNGIDNRLTEVLVEKAIKPALDVVEKEWRETWRASKAKGKAAAEDEGKGALIIVGKRDQDKFFSNGGLFLFLIICMLIFLSEGFDLENALKNPNFFPRTFPLFSCFYEF
jgi:Delta3-Delta2-enoyl-CoA isomerase